MSIHRHTAYNILGALLPLAVSIVTIPIYLQLIGEARYGVLAIVWALLGYFGLFDLGLGRATAQQIGKLHNADPAARAGTFWTALNINLGVGLIGGIAIWPIAFFFFSRVIEIDASTRLELVASIPWLVLAVPMATATGVLTGALQGRERFGELNIVSVAGTLFFQLLPLAVALLVGVELSLLLPAALLARLLTMIALVFLCRCHIFGGHRISFDAKAAKGLLQFGGWITVTALVGPLMVTLDRFVIGSLAGVRAVSHYAVPFQLAERSTLIAGAFSTALFPRFASGTPAESHKLLADSFRQLLIVMTPLTVVGIYLMTPFLGWWISPEFAASSGTAGQILLLGFWVNSLALLPFAKLQATGRPDLVAKCHLGELAPYFMLLTAGLTWFGLPGAAAAFSLRVLLDFCLLAGLAKIPREIWRALAIPALLLLAACWLSVQFDIRQREWAIAFTLQLIVTSVWSFFLAPVRLRTDITRRAKTLFGILEER